MNINQKNTEDQDKKKFSNSSHSNDIYDSETEKHIQKEKNDPSLMEIQKIKDNLEKEKDKFLRLFAEFENYKKRIQKEKLDFLRSVHQQIIIDFIPILDDLERSLKELKKSKDEIILQGVSLIKEKFIKILKEKGLNKIKIKKGDDFNTDFHEAITQIPAIKESLKGKIIEIIENGYVLQEKVIRHAKVITGK
ncbi:nucleotide exchange factor GrpE [Blattabacterium cuenoti]|uniref:nucleotide exchange factor GrpE n=1 Tax=Blattabacterium cuenoti TaxID=1653831 RepID=UPI00163BB506|nr:nucleotide exchange factor GrpE [Blattabacterium cuenoti]